MFMTDRSPTHSSAPAFAPVRSRLLQRKCSCGGNASGGAECEQCKKKKQALQRSPATQAAPGMAPPIVHDVLRSPGQPLDARTRAFMEPRFGHDFSKVRLHTDGKAAESARAVNANAYTVGNDIVFARQPSLARHGAGGSLMAHELTHVVQQAGAGSGAATLRIGEAGSAAEREADHMSHAVMSQSVHARTRLSSPPTVQRDPTPAPPQAPVGHCIPGITSSPDMVFWQSFYQQALQGAAGNDKKNAQQKADHSCEVANRCMTKVRQHTAQYQCAESGVTDPKAHAMLTIALGSAQNQDWGDSFRGALQATTANDKSAIQQVDEAVSIADQAVLRAGHIDDSTWNKYMACKGGGQTNQPNPPVKNAPAP